MPRIRYSKEEKREIITRLRAVAVSLAEYWDALRIVENAHRCSIDNDTDLYGTLAGECDTPPSFSDLSDTDVWEMFRAHTEISK